MSTKYSVVIVGGLLFACLPCVYCQDRKATDEATKEEPISAAMLRDLIGKDHRSKELMVLRKTLKDKPSAAYQEDLGRVVFHHLWHSKGLEISFDEDNKVVAVFLYSGNWEDYQKYKHELPEKLTFADKTEDVRRKLGPPEEISEGIIRDDMPLSACYYYDSKGIVVMFDPRAFAAGNATIAYVVITEPRKTDDR